MNSSVDWIDFLEIGDLLCFFIKKQSKSPISKEHIYQIYFLPALLDRKKLDFLRVNSGVLIKKDL